MISKASFHNINNQQLCLDPRALPQIVSYLTPDKKERVFCQLTASYAQFFRTAAVEQPADDNQAHSQDASQQSAQRVAIWQFKAILANKVTLNSGQQAIKLSLEHDRADYCVPLMLSRHLGSIANHWRYWAKLYNLPMVLKSANKSTIVTDSQKTLQELLAAQRASALGVRLCSQMALGVKVQLQNSGFMA